MLSWFCSIDGSYASISMQVMDTNIVLSSSSLEKLKETPKETDTYIIFFLLFPFVHYLDFTHSFIYRFFLLIT